MCMCYAYVCIVYSVCIKRSNHPNTYLEVDFMLAHSVLLTSLSLCRSYSSLVSFKGQEQFIGDIGIVYL